MSEDVVIIKILKFLHDKHFAGQPMYYFSINDVITGADLVNIEKNIVFGHLIYL